MTLLIIYVLIALGFSFLCSVLEATLLSLSPTAVETARRSGAKWAPVMEKLKADIDSPLSAILTLNTIAHTMGAAGAGAQYAKVYGSGTEAVFAGILTLAILIFTEIIPKTLGARYSLQLAAPTSWFLPKLQWTLAPLVWLCRKITRLITLGKAEAKPMHREELLTVAHLGEKEGVIEAQESAIVRNILQLGDFKVSDIMTPRPVIFMLPSDTKVSDFADLISDKPFSRVPIFGNAKDDINGFVLRSDVLLAAVKGGKDTLEELKRPVKTVPKEIGVDALFQTMLADSYHLMLVQDEFGTLVGLVTLEDVLETIVGVEIVDEKDQVADLQILARRLWTERAAKMGIKVDEEADL